MGLPVIIRARRMLPSGPALSGFWTPRLRRGLALNLAAITLLALLIAEAHSSWLQSRIFSAIATRVTWSVGPGPGPAIAYPAPGPWDERLGYSRLPDFLREAQLHGYRVDQQSRISLPAQTLSHLGLYPIYHEKSQAGLRLLDRNQSPITSFRFPQQVYPQYADIPPLVAETLLFIENRTILDPNHPHRNPAIEWPRFSHALLDYGLHRLNRRYRTIGASTLATQLEKVRHSPQGRTRSPGQKLNQMLSASLRAYQNGPLTLAEQQRIVRDYLNSLPLGASPGYGEVIGLGDGLRAWYGADFDQVNRLLKTPADRLTATVQQQQALAFRQVLSLLIATRSPSHYLSASPDDLTQQTARYLRALARDGLIPPGMRDFALRQSPSIHPPRPSPEPDYVERKAGNLIRANLDALLHVGSFYTLDRLDLTVLTSIDSTAQRKATSILRGLTGSDPAAVAQLRQPRMLASSSADAVIYSFTLFERGSGLNLLRVQTDTFNQPLDINQGTKLELGSTAKLRTLINYLQIVEQLHALCSSPALDRSKSDPLTVWAVNYCATTADKSLRPMLQAALDRRYSASPAEGFFTAGGLHEFSNFEPSDNHRILTVREAFERSVNLVFIRLMRDIERYYLARMPVPPVSSGISAQQRSRYLARFADQEGTVFLSRFYRQYQGQPLDQVLDSLGRANPDFPRRLAILYRSVRPEASAAEFTAYVHRHMLRGLMSDAGIAGLYDKFAPGKFNLQDRGYLARMHPLELWLLWYLGRHPQAGFRELVAASADERQQCYQWLFQSRYREGQDTRIHTLQEQDAFQSISAAWKRLGYPFEQLVPSYATAIGVSGDTPDALADLMGIVAGGGVRYPTTAVRELRFAENTPFTTSLSRPPAAGERVLSQTIASVVHDELISVVERGTARRAAGGIRLSDGTLLPLGGKTGTGDNRVRMYGGGGYLIGSRVASRTAVFAFIIGDRFFGTAMAFVPGTKAINYEFTSSLAVQVFKDLEPALQPVLPH